jgi:hypothetical protein
MAPIRVRFSPGFPPGAGCTFVIYYAVILQNHIIYLEYTRMGRCWVWHVKNGGDLVDFHEKKNIKIARVRQLTF